MARKKSGSSGSGGFLWGFLVGIALTALGAVAYFKYGVRPAAVAETSKPLPFERSGSPTAASAPVAHVVKRAPFGTSEDVFEAGAKVYRNDCALCHGTPGHDAGFARAMSPAAPQLWKKYGRGDVVGVSDDEVGETYWKVANGIHQSGMPAYQHVLSETQMWQVSLLLKNADQPLPDPVLGILGGR